MNTQVHPFQEFIQTPGDQKKKKKNSRQCTGIYSH